MSKTYVVKKGNSPWQIANDNGITLDEFYRLNPDVKERHMIYPGDVVRLTPDEVKERVNIRERKHLEDIANKDNLSAIQFVKHDSNYVVIDKKNKQLVVYDKNNNPVYTTDEISTGLSGDDYNTITYQKDGKIVNFAGNNSTPAGITTIKNVGLYHGSPSFIRGRINKDGSVEDIASSIHLGNTKNRLSSNGCIRASQEALANLSQYVGAGTKVYTLPEQEGSRFTVRGGKLNFTADNPIGETEGDKKYWDDYNTYVDRSHTPLVLKFRKTGDKEYDANRKAYAQTIVNNKKLVSELFGLSSDEYNRLAELALGIAEQESKFGTSRRYSLKQGIGSFVVDLLRGNSRSRGMTQIKMGTDNKEMQKYYASQGIDEDSITNAEQSAMATIGRLASMYKNEVRGRKFIGDNGVEITPEEAILYKWNGHNEQLKNNLATPDKNTYIKNVKKYAKNFDMYEDVVSRVYKNGGEFRKHLDGIKTAASFLPVVGTAIDAYDFIKDPSWENAAWLAASLGADVVSLIPGMQFGKGAVRAAKLAHQAKLAKAIEAERKADKALNAIRYTTKPENARRLLKNSMDAAKRRKYIELRPVDESLYDFSRLYTGAMAETANAGLNYIQQFK